VTKLSQILARLGAVELACFLGESTIALLELLGLKHLQSHQLAELVIDQIGPEDLLLEKSRRLEITDALSLEDANRLARLLSLSPVDNPWESIRGLPIPKGSVACEVIFAFFGHSFPESHDVGAAKPSTIQISPRYSLFPHQIQACRETISFLRKEPRPRVLLHMPTGAGKTRTAMNIIAHFLRDRLSKNDTVVWLAHSEELCEQAAEEFEEAWSILGNRPVPVYRFFGQYRSDLEEICGGVLIGGLQLLYRRSLSEQEEFLQLARRVKLVIMDEAHQAIAPTYQHLLNLLAGDPRTGILGLSATPGRSLLDAHQDMELAQFFKRQKVTLRVEGYDSPVDYLQDQGYLAKVEYDYIRYTPGEELVLTSEEINRLRTELELPDSVIARLGQDHKRNFLIVTRLLEEARTEGKIIVFACSVEHAHLLASILAAKGLRAVAVTGKTAPARRRQLIAQYKESVGIQIICNYGVLTMGFDAPRTCCAVIARPTQSVVLYSQMVGRAARGPKVGGNATCKVITVLDQLPGFRSIAEAFSYWEEIWE